MIEKHWPVCVYRVPQMRGAGQVDVLGDLCPGTKQMSCPVNACYKFNPMDGPKGPQWYEGRVFPFRFDPEGKTFVIWIAINITEKIKSQIKLEKTNNKLNKSEEENRILKGILPICSYCKKIRDEKGNWIQIEAYIQKHSTSKFSHGICEECAKKYYSDIYRPK